MRIPAAPGSQAGRRGPDRRRRPTPMFSRYTFTGRRRTSRRDTDPQERFYVDRADPAYVFALAVIVAFILIDVASTLLIVARGGAERNPIMDWILTHGAGWFVVAKLISAAVGFLVLYVHVTFPVAQQLKRILLMAYGAVVVYHLYLLSRIVL